MKMKKLTNRWTEEQRDEWTNRQMEIQSDNKNLKSSIEISALMS